MKLEFQEHGFTHSENLWKNGVMNNHSVIWCPGQSFLLVFQCFCSCRTHCSAKKKKKRKNAWQLLTHWTVWGVSQFLNRKFC